MNNDTWWRTPSGPHEKMAIDNLMLRYRLIAPKPVAGDSASGHPQIGNSSFLLTGKRPKRKYVRVCKNRKINCNNEDDKSSPRKKESDSPDLQEGRSKVVTTLQLLPVKSDLEEESAASSSDNTCRVEPSLGNRTGPRAMRTSSDGDDDADQTAAVSLVTVECVMGACDVGGSGLGGTDAEIMDNLNRDACPGFVSDALNRVRWVNRAYWRMVTNGEGLSRSPTPVVGLVVKETVVCELGEAFTCRARLQYTWGNAKCSKIVPCDVRRMDFGGFAWRLDTRAALSLGL